MKMIGKLRFTEREGFETMVLNIAHINLTFSVPVLLPKNLVLK